MTVYGVHSSRTVALCNYLQICGLLKQMQAGCSRNRAREASLPRSGPPRRRRAARPGRPLHCNTTLPQTRDPHYNMLSKFNQRFYYTYSP